MDSLAAYQHKIINTPAQLSQLLARWRLKEAQIVFTNGCFDVLHLGHFHTLAAAKNCGTQLIVGLNTDASIKRLKGATRPLFNEQTRLLQLSILACVDAVILFNEDTPIKLIEQIKPNVLVKGGDYKANEIVGTDLLKSYGGTIEIIPFLKSFSTTDILKSF